MFLDSVTAFTPSSPPLLPQACPPSNGLYVESFTPWSKVSCEFARPNIKNVFIMLFTFISQLQVVQASISPAPHTLPRPPRAAPLLLVQ